MADGAWKAIAAGASFPIAVATEGPSDSPRLCGWGGETGAPDSVTLRYESENLQITTYREAPWRNESIPVWGDPAAFVEQQYGVMWAADELGMPSLEGRRVLETTKTPTNEGHLLFEVYESLPQGQVEARLEQQKRAAAEAPHRLVELPLGETAVAVTAVGDGDLWQAGFETEEDPPIGVALSGGAIPLESLKLELVDDLSPFLGA